MNIEQYALTISIKLIMVRYVPYKLYIQTHMLLHRTWYDFAESNISLCQHYPKLFKAKESKYVQVCQTLCNRESRKCILGHLKQISYVQYNE